LQGDTRADKNGRAAHDFRVRSERRLSNLPLS
jgi:hypothetical protein